MSAPATRLATDRADFRTVMIAGTKVGALTGAAVIVYLVASRFLPAGAARDVVQAIIVLAAGAAVGLWPGSLTAARGGEGIAGAAATGLWGTVVFMAIDIVLLRPLKAYPWTWDAVGGGSSWWYLPIWWMLGTFLAWMGGIVIAARSNVLGPIAVTLVAGGALLAVLARVAGLGIALPVAAGGGLAVTLTLLALTAMLRRR